MRISYVQIFCAMGIMLIFGSTAVEVAFDPSTLNNIDYSDMAAACVIVLLVLLIWNGSRR